MLKKIQLGSTETMVSEMALGCLNFGSKNDKRTSYALLDYYTEQNGNFLDTSNNYAFWEEGCNGGESETLLGEWHTSRKNRNDMVIATKAGAYPTNREELLKNSSSREGWVNNTEGLSYASIMKAAEKSLKRLKTDYIDLYYAHIDHRLAALEDTLKAFDTLVQSGKVRHIGCSNYKTWRLERAINISQKHSWTEYCAMQQMYTYLKPRRGFDFGIQEEAKSDLLDYCRENPNITLLGYTPILWGAYAFRNKFEEVPLLKNFNTEANKIRLNVLDSIVKETGATINQVIYAWMMQGSPRILPLVAVSRLEHLKENLASVTINLTKAQLDVLNHPESFTK